MTSLKLRRKCSCALCPAFFLLLTLASSPLATCALPVGHAAPATKKLKPTDPYALIFGTVWGPDDHPVYGVRVRIRRLPDKKFRWEVDSDHAGEFAQRVPAGKADYVLETNLKGLKTADGHALHLVQSVPVHVEYDERVDVGLHLTR